MQAIRRIGVVGAGTMGRGIVQLFAQSGHDVYCFDRVDGAVPEAIKFVTGLVNRGVEKGRQTREQADATLNRIHACEKLGDLAVCDLVIEAIIEDLDAKRALFQSLEKLVSEQTILVSNTSSLVVSEIAADCKYPQRLAGLHFFNPVPLMKVVEVIAAVRTSRETVEALTAMVSGAGHRAVVAADQPGFLVNHAGRGLYTEGLRILEEQCASAQDVDTLMREAAGFRMGPFELMDLTGLDVSGKVMASIYQQFHQEPRFRPSSLVPPRIAAGLYGRKTGEGWYLYENSVRCDAPRPDVPPLRSGQRIWVDPEADQREGLKALIEQAGSSVSVDPAEADMLIIQPWGWDVSSYCVKHGLDPRRAIAIDPLPGLDKHRTVMLSPVTATPVRDAAHALLAQGGEVTVINDSPGFITQRILATIVNIATNIAQQGIATVDDIEDAVRLGLGYPEGPLSLGERVGSNRILSILKAIQEVSGDPRYRPSLWLSRRVALGVSVLTPEVSRS